MNLLLVGVDFVRWRCCMSRRIDSWVLYRQLAIEWSAVRPSVGPKLKKRLTLTRAAAVSSKQRRGVLVRSWVHCTVWPYAYVGKSQNFSSGFFYKSYNKVGIKKNKTSSKFVRFSTRNLPGFRLLVSSAFVSTSLRFSFVSPSSSVLVPWFAYANY